MQFSAQISRLMVPFFRLPWDITLRFLHSKREKKTSKSGILEIFPSLYILLLKPQDDCKYFIHFSSVLCLSFWQGFFKFSTMTAYGV